MSTIWGDGRNRNLLMALPSPSLLLWPHPLLPPPPPPLIIRRSGAKLKGKKDITRNLLLDKLTPLFTYTLLLGATEERQSLTTPPIPPAEKG